MGELAIGGYLFWRQIMPKIGNVNWDALCTGICWLHMRALDEMGCCDECLREQNPAVKVYLTADEAASKPTEDALRAMFPEHEWLVKRVVSPPPGT